MKSAEIQEEIFNWALEKEFDAPYGVLMGEGVSSKGRKYKSITFGRPRTLDAEVQVYNKNFMILNTSRFGRQVFNSYDELKEALKVL